MSASVEYNDRLKARRLLLQTDYAPWGSTFAPDLDLEKARILSCTQSIGQEIGTCQIDLVNKRFGDRVNFYTPIKVIYLGDDEETPTIIWKGFIVKERGILNNKEDRLIVTAFDYKWYLNKITKIRGKLYTTDGSLLPTALGSPATAGNGKFTYEKFRARIEDNAGYLQNEECVFNRDGIPDCKVDTAGNLNSSRCVFYAGKNTRDETHGLADTSWSGDDWLGKYWTFSSILRHLEYYWIQPYFSSSFVEFKISSNTFNNLNEVGNDNIIPTDFSIEGKTPLEAIDAIVQALPGRWIWYLNYSTGQPILEIKNIRKDLITLRSIIVGDNTKIYTADPLPNASSVEVNTDVENTVKYAIAKGGVIKLTTTIKLVPLWPRYNVSGTYRDFRNAADFNKWKKYIQNKNQKDKNPEIELDKDRKERYPLIYRKFGIARDGTYFVQNISNDSSTQITDLPLDGDCGGEYSAYTNNFIEMFFKNYKKRVKIEPPIFDKYSDHIVIFLRDDLLDYNNVDFVKAIKTLSGVEPTVVENDWKWLDATTKNIDHEIDEITGIVTFKDPQYQRKLLVKESRVEDTQLPASISDATSRIVYMTATFSTDVAAIIGRLKTNTLIDNFNGAEFSGYINADNIDIICHVNAWYPTKFEAKTTTTETDSVDTLDDVAIGTTIRKCNSFPNYIKYVGNGYEELVRAVMSFLSSYGFEDLNISVDMGYLNTIFRIGDMIQEIRNSSYDEGADGYYGLRCFISNVEHNVVGDGLCYDTKLEINSITSKQASYVGLAKVVKTRRKDIYGNYSENDMQDIPRLSTPSWSDIEEYL